MFVYYSNSACDACCPETIIIMADNTRMSELTEMADNVSELTGDDVSEVELILLRDVPARFGSILGFPEKMGNIWRGIRGSVMR